MRRFYLGMGVIGGALAALTIVQGNAVAAFGATLLLCAAVMMIPKKTA